VGEYHEPETHLIPNVLAAAEGRLPYVSIFGGDYPTPDGTAVRDYIHVSDLGSAHILALEYLRAGGKSESINLGNGQGFSVLEVVEAARQVTNKSIEARFAPRRPGDKAREVLNWRPAHADISEIIGSAWVWRLSHPVGYA
jgi:UDP-glucose 4-epimerase